MEMSQQNTQAHTESTVTRARVHTRGDCRHVSVLKTTDFMRRILLQGEIRC